MRDSERATDSLLLNQLCILMATDSSIFRFGFAGRESGDLECCVAVALCNWMVVWGIFFFVGRLSPEFGMKSSHHLCQA